MLIPIMEILFNQQGKVEQLLADPPNTSFFSEGYSLKEHGFYYLATQISEHGSEWVLLYVCVLVILFTLLKNACLYFSLYFIEFL